MAARNQKQTTEKDLIREAAETSLESFIKLISPLRVLGDVHLEWIAWATREDKKKYQLTLLPRDHMKSALVAYYVTWQITKRPDMRALLISSTSNLAEKQLKFIKDLLTSEIYRNYWPDHVQADEGKRERWTTTEIGLDHPKRRAEGVRDPSVFVGGLTTNLVGLHADLVVLDDVVTGDNAYTKEGREKVRTQYSLINSIAGTDSEEIVVGTHYHPLDLYIELKQMEIEIFNDSGEIIDKEPVYEVFERQVENRGDGSGTFLWPRQQRKDGRWFGFDNRILAEKRAKYLDRRQFRAQYYNDPNDITNSPIDPSKFQYFEDKFMKYIDGLWFYKDRRLNVYAAIDFAFGTSKLSDWTALVIVGIDFEKNIYVLDITRIKSGKISDYYKMILDAHVKWDFRKIRAETNVAQEAVVNELKSHYIKPNGLMLSVDAVKPTRHQGRKEERINAILEPRYDNLAVWHFRGGECRNLEEELVLESPPHDDIKDALANAIDVAVPPIHAQRIIRQGQKGNVVYHSRFGGLA